MSASWPGSMRGPRVTTPLLLLLLLLLSTVTRTALCQTEQSKDENGTTELPSDLAFQTTPSGEESDETQDTFGSGQGRNNIKDYTSQPTNDTTSDSTNTPETENHLNPFIILIPVVLVVLIISIIVCCIFINRRWNTQVKAQELQKEDPYLDGSSTEKVPMPMFEEDVPSVLELEMEELDKWMKKDG